MKILDQCTTTLTAVQQQDKSALLPSDSAALLIVDLDELAEAARVVIVGRLCVAKGLGREEQKAIVASGAADSICKNNGIQ